MSAGFIMIIVLFAALINLESSCSFKISPRIIRGMNSAKAQFKYFAYLEIESPSDDKTCGAALIGSFILIINFLHCFSYQIHIAKRNTGDQWILTAAHCIYKAEEVEIQLGSYEIKNFKEEGRYMTIVTDEYLYVAPGYRDRQSWNDLGLIRLPNPVKFNEYIEPISLPKICDLNENKNAIIMGYGRTSASDDRLPEMLQYAELKTLSVSECKKIFPFMVTRRSMLCASGELGQSACQGDSGGPLISGNVLIGVTSFIHKKNCESGLSQGFTDVVPYFDWIANITGLSLPKC